MSKKRILIVDDEEGIRFGMSAFLHSKGYEVAQADGCHQARKVFIASPPDAAVIDYRLADGTAFDLLRDFKQMQPAVPLIVMTAYGTIERADQATRDGAAHFLDKPVDMPVLLARLERLLCHQYCTENP